jgi:release factor glutamine methyltransferase
MWPRPTAIRSPSKCASTSLRSALFAGDDGLEVYRRLIPAAFAALVPGGFLLLEIGFGQSPIIAALIASAGFAQIEFTPDLQGIPRVACARRP